MSAGRQSTIAAFLVLELADTFNIKLTTLGDYPAESLVVCFIQRKVCLIIYIKKKDDITAVKLRLD
jgi:hypothetical protein